MAKVERRVAAEKVAAARLIAEASRETKEHEDEVAHAVRNRVTPSPTTPQQTVVTPMQALDAATPATEHATATEILMDAE
jgi:hypothetical protein